MPNNWQGDSAMKRNSLQIMIVLAASASALFGQDQQFPNQQFPNQQQQQPEEDGPGRGIARVSLMYGEVSTRRGDTGEWIASTLNQPMMAEDRLITAPGSRAEIQFDSSNMIRLGDDTEVRMGALEQRRYLLMVPRGTVTYRILRDLDADVEISTPSIAVRPTRSGTYRISVSADGTTEITVRSGEVEVLSPRGTQRLRSERTMIVRGEVSDPEFQTVGALRTDEFDSWNERRDKDLLRSRSYNYVSKDIYGAEELDNNGSWVQSEDYGAVWSPRVNSDWAPYRNGRWVWADYYGWTWASSDSFGWAPYHYGRWYSDPRHGWCWYPGARSERSFWRPALVAFFGFGSWGHVGWVPLAPFETYHPWYGSRYYGGYRNGGVNVNITNVNITNNYRNARVNNGYTTVQAGNFGRGSVQNVRVGRDQISNAGLVRGQMPISPDRSSTRYSDQSSRMNGSASREDQRFYSRGQTTRVDRVPFETQQKRISDFSRGQGSQDSGGFRGSVQGSTRDQQATPQTTPQQPSRSTGRSSDGGWERFGNPNAGGSSARQGQQTPSAPAAVTNGSGRGGWGRFGDPGSRGSQQTTQQTSQQPSTPSSSSPQEYNRGTPTPTRQQSAPSVDRSSSPSGNQGYGRGSYDSGGRGQPQRTQEAPARMSSPVVTERPSRQESRSNSGGGGGGGGNRSAAPAPAPQQSSPSRSEGSGGGRGESRGSEGRSGSRNK